MIIYLQYKTTCTTILSLAQQLKKEVMIILLSLPPFSVAVPEIAL
jgi:hypothetical protein